MNPPIRDKSHYDRLWYAVRNNYNDTIGSDHAPHLKTNKDKKYPNSPSGMPGVQTLLPVMLDHVNNNKLKLEQLINLICENPVKIFGIKNKGYLKENYDADITIVDLNKSIKIKNEDIQSKCGWSPFHGESFKGSPIATIVNGKIKMKNGKILGEPEGPLNFLILMKKNFFVLKPILYILKCRHFIFNLGKTSIFLLLNGHLIFLKYKNF